MSEQNGTTATDNTFRATEEDYITPKDGKFKRTCSSIASFFTGFISAFNRLTGSVVRSIIVVALLLAAVWYFSPSARHMVNDISSGFISTPTNALKVDLVDVNGYYTKQFVWWGTSQIKFNSPFVNGTLNAKGDIDFVVEGPGLPYAEVESVVVIKPAFEFMKSQRYVFTGNGIHGAFDVVSEGKEIRFEDFRLGLNLDLEK